MTFRPVSQHHECATCIRHRAMVRALSGHSNARAAQQRLFYDHLRQQHLDRICYWTMRAESRDRSMPSVTVVTDGMDQAKFALPRHEAMRSKEFAQFMRPRLHISCAIAHGWLIVFQISPPDLPKDGNASIELISHVLSMLKDRGAHLPSLRVTVQSDNTCRECKNSLMVRFLASLTSSRTVGSCALSCLRAGHSHEDIDQIFGQLARWILRWKVLETPCDVGRCIQAFLDQAKLFEKERFVVLVDRTRDWTLGSFGFLFVDSCLSVFGPWG